MRERTPVTDTEVIESICSMNWRRLSKDSLVDAAWAYYFFSVQFRENLQIARRVFPEDPQLQELEAEECETANLSPWPNVVASGEKLDHDEFMRRSLALTPVDAARLDRLHARGLEYLEAVRATDDTSRALSMASYEGGGLESVFRAMLTARDWSEPALEAFQHFLVRHLELDGHHGGLVSHLDGRRETISLWQAFESLLVACVPSLVAPSPESVVCNAPLCTAGAETAAPAPGLGAAPIDCAIAVAGTI